MGHLELTSSTQFVNFSIVSIVVIHEGIEAHPPDV